ncbi:ferritin-like domain-containing protein [Pedobacter steynii]
MKNLQEQEKQELLPAERSIFTAPLQRRSFLQFAGAGAATVALVAAGCKKDRHDPMVPGGVTLNFKDDFGVLNYAYALEQLEAAFYIQVASNPPSGFSPPKSSIFRIYNIMKLHTESFLRKL